MESNVLVRFYEELNDFLPSERHKQAFEVLMKGPTSVQDLIETLGVPHTKVHLILVNGNSVSFSHMLKDRDRISVYPAFETFDISNVTKLRKPDQRTLTPDP